MHYWAPGTLGYTTYYHTGMKKLFAQDCHDGQQVLKLSMPRRKPISLSDIKMASGQPVSSAMAMMSKIHDQECTKWKNKTKTICQ